MENVPFLVIRERTRDYLASCKVLASGSDAIDRTISVVS